MKKVLIVDDNKDILQLVQLVLELKGYEVEALWNGSEVIEAIKDFSPDVVLLDVFLSGMNGTDICKEIKTLEEIKHTCIILFSAHTTSEQVIKECSADGFISKPFDMHTLTETIEKELGKCD